MHIGCFVYQLRIVAIRTPKITSDGIHHACNLAGIINERKFFYPAKHHRLGGGHCVMLRGRQYTLRIVGFANRKLGLLGSVPLAQRAQVSHDARVYLARATAGGALLMLARNIAVRGADAKGWRDSKVRQVCSFRRFF